jgi:tetratricopeptide (TPR) repeat protein
MHLGNALLEFWIRTNHRREAAEQLPRILTLTDNLPPSFILARFLFSTALAVDPWDNARAEQLYQQCQAVSRAAGDKFSLANTLNKLGGIAYRRGDYASWEAYLRESEPLKLEVGAHYLHALVLGFTGRELAQLGRFEEGLALSERALALHRQIGDKWGLIIALHNYSQAALLHGNLDKAETLAREYLALTQALGAVTLLSGAEYMLGCVMIAHGHYAQAATLLEHALEVRAGLMIREDQIDLLEAFALLATAQNQPTRALCLAAAVFEQRATDGIVLPPVLQARFDQMLASARQQLSKAAATIAWAKGRKMTLGEAVAVALEEYLNPSGLSLDLRHTGQAHQIP